jgi:hypothetical protein
MLEENYFGVIVGASSHVEWMLPWWWKNYAAHNALPVVFFDFGLSLHGKKWCQERGKLIPLKVPKTLIMKEVEKDRRCIWEKTSGKGIWKVRSQWFKKPFAFLQSPFAKTLWLDLDCEVRGDLAHLMKKSTFALVRESLLCNETFERFKITAPGEVTYNSGVVAFEKNSPILQNWLEEVLDNNHLYIGDQNALSRALFRGEKSFEELPSIYNWDPNEGENKEALIVHFSTMSGKQKIKKELDVLSSMGLV